MIDKPIQGEFVLIDNKLSIEDCNWKCLTDCPLPPGMDCIWDDPLIGIFDLVEYPEFFWWRVLHDIQPEEDWSVNGSNPTAPRCPRCHSTHVSLGYPYIQCLHCNYNEPLIDFPI